MTTGNEFDFETLRKVNRNTISSHSRVTVKRTNSEKKAAGKVARKDLEEQD